MRFLIKAGGLLLILALPVLIYVFLQAFGENKYDLPVYYENGVDTLVAGCQFSGEGQYTVPSRYFKTASGHPSGAITIVFFRPSGIDVSDPVISGLARAMNVFHKEGVNVLLLSVPGQAHFEQLMDKVVAYGNERSQWSLFSVEKQQFPGRINCDFVISGSVDGEQVDLPLLLVDKRRRIRGYYQADEREEIDRLVVEVNILLQNDKG